VPGRVNLIGDHTDYQAGWVLPFALDVGTTVTVEVNDTSRVDVTSDTFGAAHSLEIDDDGVVPAWSRYVFGAVQLLRERNAVPPCGAVIRIESSLPIGVGLASSASVTCGVIAALMQACGEAIDRVDVARLAQRVEHDYAGAEVGFMDPAAVMFGRRGHALLIDTRALTVEPIACDVDAAGVELLLVDSGEKHATSGADYATRVAQCRAAANALSVDALRDVHAVGDVNRIEDSVVRARARHVITENQRVLEAVELLRSKRVRELGPLLLGSHESLRDDFAASTPTLDLIVETAMEAGALGARVTGAGFGGSVIVLLDRTSAADVTSSLHERCATSGHPTPSIRRVVPADGARTLAAD
jgi:galactokinase